MELSQDRVITLINLTGLDELVRKSPISYIRWQNLKYKKARVSSEEIDAMVRIYPKYALWIASGEVAPDCGQTSPTYDEANRSLAAPSAG
jgi:hypothetical protein